MPDARIQQRIFVVGCPRSGTTLLQSILASHPAVHSFPETHLIRHTIQDSARREYGFAGCPKCEWPAMAAHMLRARLGIVDPRGARRRMAHLLRHVDRWDLWQDFPRFPIFTRPTIAAQIDRLDRMAIDAGCDRWIEKSPQHVLYTREIERHVPGACIIHIVRAPKDNIASLYAAAHENPGPFDHVMQTIEGCAREWTNCYRATMRNQDRAAHHFVHYESLTNDPRAETERVCEFLGLPFDERMIEDRAAASAAIVREQETHKDGLSDQIARRSKFDKVFAAEQQNEVRQFVRHLCPEWGDV